MGTMNKVSLGLIVVVLAVVVFSCATSVETIRSNPEDYVGKDVMVRGTVTRKMPLPLTDYSLCILSGENEEMILFALNDYAKGDTIMTKVHVIGTTEEGGRRSAKQAADAIIKFLIDNKITEKKIAEKISNGLVMVVSTITGAVEGSYLLAEVQ